MTVYEGRRRGTHRIVIWANNRSHEWIFEGTKADAKKFDAEKRLELRAGLKSALRAAPKFSDFSVGEYQPHAITHLGADTWNKVRRYQVATLIDFFGPTRIDELSSQLIDEYKNERIEEGDVEPVTVNNELRVLRAMINWGRTARRLPFADFKIEMLPLRGKRRVPVWTANEVQRLFSAAERLEPELLPILTFMLNTGCRKGEALAAEWSWIDWHADMIRISISEDWQPKSKRERDIPLGDGARAALAGPKRHERWLFPSRLGDRYKTFPKEAYWRVRDEANLKGGPHTTRHTFASNFLQSVPDLFLLSQILGHSHERTTAIYSHLLPEHLGRARNAVTLLPKTMATTMAERKKSRNSA